jgi:UDPglucose--hexose-1-phosphate uridylyltransferase
MHVAGVCQTTLFQNCRPEAGASIEHVHAQLVGSPVLTHALAARADRCAEYFRANRKSLLVATVDFELRDGGRIVEKRGRFVAFCPFASRSGFQVRIAATTPIETFDRVSLSDLRDVVWLLRSTIAKLERSFEGVPYNWVLHLPPNHSQDRLGPEVFPWFVEIIPRLGRWAGLELAEGGWINEWPPDYAAGKLRA